MGYFITTSTYMGEANTRTWIEHGFCWLQKVAKWREWGFFTLDGVNHCFRITFKYKLCYAQFMCKDQPLAVAMPSTISDENGKGACSDSKAITLPWLSWMTTPSPALPNSEKMAPSKFNLRQFGGGKHHCARGWGRDIAEGWLRDCWLCWKVANA